VRKRLADFYQPKPPSLKRAEINKTGEVASQKIEAFYRV